MDYKNGYKVVYEVAADGKRTFYATTSNEYPTRDKNGNITDTVLATFNDADFAGKTIYEYKGEFYVSTKATPEYNTDGTPKDAKIDSMKTDGEGFAEIFVEKQPEDLAAPASIDPEDEEPVEEPAEAPEDEPEADPEVEE